MTKYTKLEPHEVHDFWPLIEQWVDPAILGDPTICPDDIRHLCLSGICELWIVSNDLDRIIGFLSGRVMDNFRGKYYYAAWFGGTEALSWIKEGYETIKAHAKRKGCLVFNMVGPLAYKKLFGIEPKGVYYSVIL